MYEEAWLVAVEREAPDLSPALPKDVFIIINCDINSCTALFKSNSTFGGGGIMQLFLSVTISPLPIPESTSSLHPNSSKIIERMAFGDEAIGFACRPLKMAGHSIELASPVKVQS